MLDWLKTILGEAYSEDIDTKVSAEIGKNFVARADFNATNEAKKQLEASIKERDKQLEALKKSSGDVTALKEEITRLQEKNTEQAKEHADAIKQIKIDNAIESALIGAKAKNLKAVKALLDLDKAELNEDGTVKGLDEQIKSLAKSPDTGFLFETSSKDGSFKGLKPAEGNDGNSGGGMTLEKLRKLSPAERFDFSVKHPDEYKSLYGGTN